MALIVEDGTGLTNADTYASLAEYEAYLSALGLTDDDDDASKEVRLREGAEYIDLECSDVWSGEQSNPGTATGVDGQALDWPRLGAMYSDGRLIGSSVIPIELKRANIIVAFSSKTITLMPDIDTDDSGSLEAEDIVLGPLRVSERFAGAGKELYPYLTKAERYLQQITMGGGGGAFIRRG